MKRKSLTGGQKEGKGAEGRDGARRASEGLMHAGPAVQPPLSSPPQRLLRGMLSPLPLLQRGLRARGRQAVLRAGGGFAADGKAPKCLGGDISCWDTGCSQCPTAWQAPGRKLRQERAGERANVAPGRPEAGISHVFLALDMGLRPSASRNWRQGDRGQWFCPPCCAPPRHEDASRPFRSRLLAGCGRL